MEAELNPESGDYLPSKRIILAPVILTPEKVCEKNIDSGKQLMELSFGSAKKLKEAAFLASMEDEWNTVIEGLKFLASETSMFFAKRKLGDLGACEVVTGTTRWLVGGDSDFTIPEEHKHITALIWGCKAMAVLADTELANKIRLARAGAISVVMSILRAQGINRYHELMTSALQVLLNLPNKVMSERWNSSTQPLVKEYGHEDNIAMMVEAGVVEMVCGLSEKVLGEIEKLHVPQNADILLIRTDYQEQSPRLYRLMEMCCRMIQILGGRTNGRTKILACNPSVRDVLLKALQLATPILPVPSVNDVSPLPVPMAGSPGSPTSGKSASFRRTDDDDDDDPAIAEAAYAAQRQKYLIEVELVERKEKLVRACNVLRYECQRIVLNTIITMLLDPASRRSMSDGHDDRTNVVKVVLKTMVHAFADLDSTAYRVAKCMEMEEVKHQQQCQGWTTSDQLIYKAVKRNTHMAAHRNKAVCSLLDTLKQRAEGAGNSPNKAKKGFIQRGPPRSPIRVNVLNLHALHSTATPPKSPSNTFRPNVTTVTETGSYSPAKSIAEIKENVGKCPPSLIVAEHACWALSILTTNSGLASDVDPYVSNRLELLECGEGVLRAMARSVADIVGLDLASLEQQEDPLTSGWSEAFASSVVASPSSTIGPLIQGEPVPALQRSPSSQKLSLDLPNVSSAFKEGVGAAPDIGAKASSSAAMATGGLEADGLMTIKESKLLDGCSQPSGNVVNTAVAPGSQAISANFVGTYEIPHNCLVSHTLMHQLHNHDIPFYSRLFKLVQHVSCALQPTHSAGTPSSKTFLTSMQGP